MARQYKVEGTRDFLYGAIVLLLLGAWAVRDGWFPSPSVQAKHPRRVPVAFEIGGVIAEILVQPGDPVRPDMVLARLSRQEQESHLAEIERRYKEIAEAATIPFVETDEPTETRARLAVELSKARQEMAIREIKAPIGGVVRAVRARVSDVVQPGAPIVEIDPQDHFYLFNKSLAIICLVGAVVCLVIHRQVG